MKLSYVFWGSATCIAILFIYYLSLASNNNLLKLNNVYGGLLPETRCIATADAPVIYNMRTALGVNYDAGHWFHMSENFMTQHSILRSKNLLTNASDVIYVFDKGSCAH
jgi:hypothetical protein